MDGRSTWVVRLPSGWSTPRLDNFTQSMPGSSTASFVGNPSGGGLAMVVLRANLAELEQLLVRNPGAKYVEQDTQMWKVGGRPPAGAAADRRTSQQQAPSLGAAGVTLNPKSWGLDRIDARSGLDGSYTYPAPAGAGVHVYMLDTGILTTHQDFGGRAVPTLESLGRRVVCKRTNDHCARDRDGHGTHTAATVAGSAYGVAKSATVHAVKVLDDSGSGTWSNFLAAIDWVVTSGQRPAVISASLGGPGQLQSVGDAIRTAAAAGVTVVVAAGNDGADACSTTPAFAAAAVAVGSTDRSDARSAFSNVGSCVDLFAPGSSITSAGIASTTASAVMSGTSMACPHVSGAAALLLGQDSSLLPVDVVALLRSRATHAAIQDVGAGSANLLLYTGSLAGTGAATSNATGNAKAVPTNNAATATATNATGNSAAAPTNNATTAATPQTNTAATPMR